MNSPIEIPEYDKLRIIYSEIINGFTYSGNTSDNLNLYIKHLKEVENVEIVKRRHSAFFSYVNDGIPTLKQRLETIKEDGVWNDKEEERMQDLKQIVIDNEKNLLTIIPQQRKSIEKILDEHRLEYNKLSNEKNALIGHTAEEYAEKDSYNYLIYLSFFKDMNLNEKVFTNVEEVENLDFDEIEKYSNLMETALKQFKEENIRKISVLPFFINPLSFCKENIHTFLNQPFCSLTSFQLTLISFGSRNLNILSEATGEPPTLKDGASNINELIDWYDMNYSIMLGKRSKAPSGITTSSRQI